MIEVVSLTVGFVVVDVIVVLDESREVRVVRVSEAEIMLVAIKGLKNRMLVPRVSVGGGWCSEV